MIYRRFYFMFMIFRPFFLLVVDRVSYTSPDSVFPQCVSRLTLCAGYYGRYVRKFEGLFCERISPRWMCSPHSHFWTTLPEYGPSPSPPSLFLPYLLPMSLRRWHRHWRFIFYFPIRLLTFYNCKQLILTIHIPTNNVLRQNTLIFRVL